MKFFSQNRNGNVLANLLKVSVATAVCVFFAACGDDSSSSGPSDPDDEVEENVEKPETTSSSSVKPDGKSSSSESNKAGNSSSGKSEPNSSGSVKSDNKSSSSGNGKANSSSSEEKTPESSSSNSNEEPDTVKDPVIEIDSIPPVIVFDNLVWMAEDLTHNGSADFTLHESSYACPAGWRLPTENELMNIAHRSGELGDLFGTGTELRYFTTGIGGNGVALTCSENRASCILRELIQDELDSRIRCVNDNVAITASECECTASEPADNSVTWSVTGCKEGVNEISGYTWDFGSNSANVTVSGAKATMTFNSVAAVTPQVKVNSKMKVGDEFVKIPQRVTCPMVRAGFSESAIVFKHGASESLSLSAGTSYTARLDGECNQYAPPEITCESSSSEPNSVTIDGQTYSGTGYVISKLLDRSICENEFTISVSEDMDCYMRFQ
ncbi:hypothetical protein [Fibrobacter succinogenes]|uniref:hypothetical protein n=1 Tax=Fibrobacter succinogenes TaxID=833 RepID=UPI0013D7C78D|nr:hypothetical protein [Fibrobacter succinogenes]